MPDLRRFNNNSTRLGFSSCAKSASRTGRDALRGRAVEYVHDADRLALRSDAALPLQADGEDLGDVQEVTFECERSALSVLV